MKFIVQGTIRILTVLFFLEFIQYFITSVSSIIQYFSRGGSGMNLYYQLFGLVVITAIAGVLVFFGWWKSERISRILVGELDEDPLVISTSNTDLVQVILSILGIYLFVTSVADIAGLAACQFRALTDGWMETYLEEWGGFQLFQDWVTAIVTLIFGILLMGKGRRIGLLFINFWKYGSLLKPPQEEDAESEEESD